MANNKSSNKGTVNATKELEALETVTVTTNVPSLTDTAQEVIFSSEEPSSEDNFEFKVMVAELNKLEYTEKVSLFQQIQLVANKTLPAFAHTGFIVITEQKEVLVSLTIKKEFRSLFGNGHTHLYQIGASVEGLVRWSMDAIDNPLLAEVLQTDGLLSQKLSAFHQSHDSFLPISSRQRELGQKAKQVAKVNDLLASDVISNVIAKYKK